MSCAVLTSVGRSFALSLVLASSALSQGPPPAAVHAVRVEVRETARREAITGSLRAASAAVLAAREEGPVLEVVAREGTFVRAGEPIVKLDDRRLAARRAELVATEAEAAAMRVQRNAELGDARADLKALESASNGNAVSEREVRVARTLVATAEAAAEAATQRELALEAQVTLIDVRIADATLRAPFDGTVVARHVEVGEWVQPGTDLVELVSTGRLEAWFDVPERLIGQASTFPATIEVSSGATEVPFRAERPRVVPRVDPRTRRFSVVYDVVKDGDVAPTLSPGTSASAWFPAGGVTRALMIPKDALVYRPFGVSVVTVNGKDEGGPKLDGVAGLVPIDIWFESEREVAIAPETLPAGAVVIVEGNERMRPGDAVSATIAKPAEGETER